MSTGTKNGMQVSLASRFLLSVCESVGYMNTGKRLPANSINQVDSDRCVGSVRESATAIPTHLRIVELREAQSSELMNL